METTFEVGQRLAVCIKETICTDMRFTLDGHTSVCESLCTPLKQTNKKHTLLKKNNNKGNTKITHPRSQ